MKVVWIIAGILAAVFIFFIWCYCRAASIADNEEEVYWYEDNGNT